MFDHLKSVHMKKNILLIVVLAGIYISSNTQKSIAQGSNPVPQSLPYSQNFNSLAHASSSYPAGWQGWTIGTSSGSTFKTNAATADAVLNASSTAATNSGGVHNYNGKIGILSSSSTDAALCLSLNTTGYYRVIVSSDITSTIRNPYDGTSNTRINEFTLQYRVGTSGSFTTVFTAYSNNTTNQTGAVTTPQNTQLRNWLLPPDADNQPLVQVRWVQRDNTGSGSRPSFAVDNVSVCSFAATPSVSIAVTSGTNPTAAGTPVTFTATPVNGGTAQYQWKVNGGNAGTNSAQFTPATLSNGDVITCSMTSLLGCLNIPPTVTSNSIAMIVCSSGDSVVPSVTVACNAAHPVIDCQGSLVTFTATPVNGGTNPVYQWKKNNINTGTNSAIYIDSSLATGSYTISCEMTSSAFCISGQNPVTSNGVGRLVVGNAVTPTGIIATDTVICAGESVTLYRVGGSIDAATFAWYQYGCGNIFNGGEGAFLAGGDSIILSPSSTTTYYLGVEGFCASSSCQSVTITVHNNVTPSVSISSDFAGTIACQGTVVTYTATAAGGGSNPVYHWFKHPNIPVGTNSNIYIDSTGTPGNYNLFCEMTSSAECISGQNPVTSNGIGLLVLETATLPTGITASKTTICAGESVTLYRVGGNAGSGIFSWYQGGCGNVFNGGSGAFIAGGDSLVVTPSSTTTYFLSVEGLCPLSTCQSITINYRTLTIPPTSLHVSSDTICALDDLVVSVVGGSLGTGASWRWRVGSCNAVITGTGDSVVLGLTAGVKTVFVTSSGACNTTCTASVPITVNPRFNWFRDFDNDGFGTNSNAISACSQPTGYILPGNDCNDINAAINPLSAEICGNGIDENCSGNTDDVCGTNVTLHLKFIIEGYYAGGGIMSAVIDPVNLPVVCDTVTVSIHQSVAPFNIVQTKKGVITTAGIGNFFFPETLNQSYYISIKSRSGVEVWSQTPVNFNASTVDFDFAAP